MEFSPAKKRIPKQSKALSKKISDSFSRPDLRLNLSNIQLGLSSPDFYLRLSSARRLVLFLESDFRSHGINKVLETIDKIVEDPRLFYHSEDPRLNGNDFDSERAKNNMRLGCLMAIQSICRNQACCLRRPLAQLCDSRGFLMTLISARTDQSFAVSCYENKFAIPTFNKSLETSLDYFFRVFKYAITCKILEDSKLKEKFYPNLKPNFNQLNRNAQTREAILDTVVNLAIAIMETHSQDQSKLFEIFEEIKQVMDSSLNLEVMTCHILAKPNLITINS